MTTLDLLSKSGDLRDEEIKLHRELARVMTAQDRIGREIVRRLNEQKERGLIPDEKPFFVRKVQP